MRKKDKVDYKPNSTDNKITYYCSESIIQWAWTDGKEEKWGGGGGTRRSGDEKGKWGTGDPGVSEYI